MQKLIRQFFHQMKFDLEGHRRSHMANLKNLIWIIHLSTDFEKLQSSQNPYLCKYNGVIA